MSETPSRQQIEAVAAQCSQPWDAAARETLSELVRKFVPTNEVDWRWSRDLATDLSNPVLGVLMTERFLREEQGNVAALLVGAERYLTPIIKGRELRATLELIEQAEGLSVSDISTIARRYVLLRCNHEGVIKDRNKALSFFDQACMTNPRDAGLYRQKLVGMMQMNMSIGFATWKGVAKYWRDPNALPIIAFTAAELKVNTAARVCLKKSLGRLRDIERSTIAPLAAAAALLEDETSMRRITSSIDLKTVFDKNFLPWLLASIRNESLVVDFRRAALQRQCALDPSDTKSAAALLRYSDSHLTSLGER